MTTESVVLAILEYLLTVISATTSYVFILIGPGLILAFFMHLITEFIGRQAARSCGLTLYLLLFGWLGSTVHELGHAIFHVLFMHQILKIKFFDPQASGGWVGYVRYRYDRTSLYQVVGIFFSATGPIILGTLSIYAISLLLVGPEVFEAMNLATISSESFNSHQALWGLVTDIWDGTVSIVLSLLTWKNLTSWKFYVFLYVTFSVGSAISLSPPDLRNAWKGFAACIALIFLFNMSTMWIGADFARPILLYLSQLYSGFYALMLFALILNSLIAVIFIIPWFLSRS